MRYRVDRSHDDNVPCGMNGMLYYGNSFEEAQRIFLSNKSRHTSWNVPNNSWRLLLSEYHDKQGFVVRQIR